jgi:L-glutamine:2-deoxy-scyllo-inosose/3-amino-2,3-dideoxy-scyllo-inosose aminotransferase
MTEQLALTGGSPVVTLQSSPWPIIGEQEVEWMAEVVHSGKWSWMGPHETAFTEDFRQFLGANYAMCVSNGTVSIQCALQAVGVEPGDEVIVPGLTWVATAHAALDIGAQVVLVDIDPETLCIDPEAVAAAITPRTRALIPVQLYGCMCDMDALGELARKHDLRIVEDAAHQHGSQWRGSSAGTLGDAGSFSFQQSKVLTSGEGGFITCRDEEAYQTAFALKQVGWTPPPDMKPAGHYGHNYRITEMQCVLLRGGLSRLAEQTQQRDANVQYLAAGLEKLGGPLRVARRDPRVTRQAYYAMTMVFEPEKAEGISRSQYLQALTAEGFSAGETYELVYRNPLLNLYDRTSPIPYRRDLPQDYAALRLPGCEQAKNETAVVMSHTRLLGDRAYLDQLLEAVEKVNRGLDDVKKHFAQL